MSKCGKVGYTLSVRVLGIDPGLSTTGYACVEILPTSADPVLVEGGVLRLKRGTTLAYRLAQLSEDLCGVLDELKPRAAAVEELFSTYKHPRTSILMGHARGVVLLAMQTRNVEIHELSATAVKKSITGNGHASKEQMQRSIMAQCNLPELPSPSDLADAIGIALCAARRIMVEPGIENPEVTGSPSS